MRTSENIWKQINPDEIFPDLGSASAVFIGAQPEKPSIINYKQSLELRGRLTPAVQEAIAKALVIRAQTHAIFYIAGPLTGINEELKGRYPLVSDLLANYPPITTSKELGFAGYVPHLHGTDPVKHPDVSRDEVRDIDNLWADVLADCHINFLAPTAHGNAIEEGWAEKTMIPTIYMNPRGNRLSRLTGGMNNILQEIEYDDFEQDGLASLRLELDEMHAWLKTFPNRDPREFYYLSYSTLREPLQRLAGFDPNEFNPNVPVDKIMIYMKDPSSPYYGQAGDLLWHDWMDYGLMGVSFPGGHAEVHDESGSFTFWRKFN